MVSRDETEQGTSMNGYEPVTIRPIGRVISDFRDFDGNPDYEGIQGIEIHDDLAPGLEGIEHFSRLHVIYHQHRRAEWMTWAGEAWGGALTTPVAGSPYRKGIYTTRAPGRPSGLGSCVVELVRREGTRLRVRGLDALDGTPVLDLKIYIPAYDAFPDAAVPLRWCQTHDPETASRMLHWATTNVAIALGMRAGLAAMTALGISREGAERGKASGEFFFVQGVEAVCGLSPLRGNLAIATDEGPVGGWSLRLTAAGRAATVRLRERDWRGADEVLAAPVDALFRPVEIE